MTDLAVIIVSWNVCDLLRGCLRGVDASLAGSGLRYKVVVVDNASTDGTPAMVRAEFPHVTLMETGRNLGFAGGNNVALRELLGMQHATCYIQNEISPQPPVPSPQSPAPRYVLLLNPDTVPVGDALPTLVRYLEAHPERVAVGPQLRYGDGSVQSSRRRFPTMGTFFWESTPLERLWPANPWAGRYRCADAPDDQEQLVGWLVGAALLVRTSAIAEAGLLDEGFFMYSEELEWQWRMQNAKGKMQKELKLPPILHFAFCILHSRIAYLPSAVVTHYEGRSSEQALVGRHLNFQRSKLRLARMLYGRSFAATLRLFLLGCYLWELLAEGAKLALGHRRDLRRQRIGVYAEVVDKMLRQES